MQCFSRGVWTVLLFAAGLANAPSAGATESCGDLLRFASRDMRTSTTYDDQRKFFYEAICKGSGKSGNLNYEDANSALGLGYTSKDEYCSAEQSATSSISYSRNDSSLVVREALDAYYRCRALETRGIAADISLPVDQPPVVFSVGIARTGSDKQTIHSVRLSDTAALECTALKDGKQIPLSETANAIAFELPESKSRWTMSCTRKGRDDGAGNVSYPPVQLIVTTSGGDLPLALPEVGLASATWARDLRNEMRAQIERVQTRVDGLSLLVDRKPAVYDMAGAGQSADCNGNEIVYGFIGAQSSNQALDMWKCAEFRLSVPPR